MNRTWFESELAVRAKMEQMHADARARRDRRLAAPPIAIAPWAGVRRTVGIRLIRIGGRLVDGTAQSAAGRSPIRPTA